jgi:SAM-dependent methyltransferase
VAREFTELDEQAVGQRALLLQYLDGIAQSPLILRTRAIAREQWQLDHPRRLLDAGAGSGDVARGLVPLTGRDGEVVALDASETMIDAARRRGDGGPVRYEIGDVYSLPFPDGYFDGVRSERVLQHLDDPDAAIREMVRVLRPGGRMCVLDTDWDSVLVDGSPKGIPDFLRPIISFVGLKPTGRTLRRRMVLAGLTDVLATPVTVATTSRDEAGVVFPMVHRRGLEFAQIDIDESAERWLEAVDGAEADGTFQFALTIWVVTGTSVEQD